MTLCNQRSQRLSSNWRWSFSLLSALLGPSTYSTVCEISALTLKAALCTIHLSHNRSDSSRVSLICKILSKAYSSVLIMSEPMTSAKNHKPCSAWHLMQIISKRLKCLEGFLKVFDLMSAAEPLPSLIALVLVYYHHDY